MSRPLYLPLAQPMPNCHQLVQTISLTNLSQSRRIKAVYRQSLNKKSKKIFTSCGQLLEHKFSSNTYPFILDILPIEVPNTADNMNSRAVSACYPQRHLYYHSILLLQIFSYLIGLYHYDLLVQQIHIAYLVSEVLYLIEPTDGLCSGFSVIQTIHCVYWYTHGHAN